MEKKIKLISFLFSVLLLVSACAGKAVKIKPVKFDYLSVAASYFNPDNPDPFPLTVQRGNNLYNSVTANGKYLFYTTSHNGNYDIWFRDLTSSIIVPVTSYPTPEYKPAISPDGRKLVYVSEEFDSEGDIFFSEIDPGKMVSRVLKKGEREISRKFRVLTNPGYKEFSRRERLRDSDPYWSPDGRYIVFSTERFTPGKMNLALIDTKDFSIRPLTVNGGESPSWSLPGIAFVSYRDNEAGEIYLIDPVSKSETRITNNRSIEYSPTLTPDGSYVYFSSIVRDSNADGRIDKNDKSAIVRLERKSGDMTQITNEDYSAFDTRVSAFNGGSIIFSAALYNTINVYFIPLAGQIPRQKNIQEQFSFAGKYREKYSLDGIRLALRSVKSFFADDPLYPVFSPKIQLVKLVESAKSGNKEYYDIVYKSMHKSKNPFARALLADYLLNRKGQSAYAEIMKIYETASGASQNLKASILEVAAEELENREPGKAIEIYRNILQQFPDFYHSSQVKIRIGDLRFSADRQNIPAEYALIFATAPDHSDKKHIYTHIESVIGTGPSAVAAADHLLAGDLPHNELYYYLLFLKAKNTSDHKASNLVIDSYLGALGKDNYIYLSSRMLRAANNRLLGEVNSSLDDLREFLDNYNPAYQISVRDEEMEKSFSFFENKAVEHRKKGNLKDAAFHYFFNTQNMYLCRAKNLYNDTLYDKYSVYYQQKMVDSILGYSRELAEKKNKNLFAKFNILTGSGVSVLGGFSKIVTGLAGDNKLVSELGNLQKVNVLDPEGLEYIESHFKLKLPLARPVLDYASVYGYAYFLIRKSVILEDFYYKTGGMTTARKEQILKNFKIAEYELKWIIFSNPRYTDAYQLLGWLYQYVDVVKAGSKPGDSRSEGEYYESVYDKYFPSGHFEENIDLYHQVIDLVGADFSNKKILSDLHLNLANNYFILNNYPKAFEQYTLVENLGNYINQSVRFENFRQEGLYRFHFAKTAVFTGDYRLATDQFDKTAEIYSRNEFIPMAARFTGKKEDKSLRPAAARLALVFTLNGLTQIESGDYSKALLYFIKADRLNISSVLEKVNLKNLIALCYYKTGSSSKAMSLLREANAVYASNKKLLAFKGSPGGFFWNMVMPDETRIIGDGRIPGKMSLLTQHLFTIGLESSITMKNHNLELAEKFLQEKSVFSHKEKSLIGKASALNALTAQAWLAVQKKNYPLAKKIYHNAYVQAGKWGMGSEAKRILTNLSVLYGNLAESADGAVSREDFTELKQMFEGEHAAALKYCLGENDGNENLCQNGWKEYDPLLGTLNFWIGKYSDDPVEKTVYYSAAWSLLKDPGLAGSDLAGLSIDIFQPEERLRMGLVMARIQYELGDSDNYLKSLFEAEDFAQEFSLTHKLIEIRLLLAEAMMKQNDVTRAGNYLEKIRDLFVENPDLVVSVSVNILKSYYNSSAGFYRRTNKDEKFFIQDRMLQKSELFRQALSANLEFRDEATGSLYNQLKTDLEKAAKIRESIQTRKFKRLPVKDDQEVLLETTRAINRTLAGLGTTANSLLFDPFDKKLAESDNWIILKKAASGYQALVKTNGKTVKESLNNLSALPGRQLTVLPDSNLGLDDLQEMVAQANRLSLSSEPGLEYRMSPSSTGMNQLQLAGYDNLFAENATALPSLLVSPLPPEVATVKLDGKTSVFNLLNLHRIYHTAGVDSISFRTATGEIRFSPSASRSKNGIDPVRLERAGMLSEAVMVWADRLAATENSTEQFKIRLKLAGLKARIKRSHIETFYSGLLKSDRKEEVFRNMMYVCYTENLAECDKLEKKHTSGRELKPDNNLMEFVHGGIPAVKFTNKYESDSFLAGYYAARISLGNLDFSGTGALLKRMPAVSPGEKARINEMEDEMKAAAYFIRGKGELPRIAGKHKYADPSLNEYMANIRLAWAEFTKSNSVPVDLLYFHAPENETGYLSHLTTGDRSMIFFLLRKSANETGHLLKSLIEAESRTGNHIRAGAMTVAWAEELFTSGDTVRAGAVLADMPMKQTGSWIGKRAALLRYKLALAGGEAPLSADSAIVKKDFLLTATAWNRTDHNYPDIVRQYIRSKKNTVYSGHEKNNLLDLIYYLQKKAIKQNNSEGFLDLAFAKDKYLLNGNRFGTLPDPEKLSEKIMRNLPPQQVFIAVVDFGTETYYIRLADGKSKGDILYRDNNRFRAELGQYYRKTSQGGSDPLGREALEDRLKKGIRLDGKTTYLYLGGIHFKTPVTQRSSDNFYFVLSPEKLATVFKMKQTSARGFNLKNNILTNDSVMAAAGKKEFELNRYPSGPDFLLWGNNFADHFNGLWMYADGNLAEKNLRAADRKYSGPGIVSLSSDNYNNIYFIKEFTRIYKNPVNLKERFLRAQEKTAKRYTYDNEWTGYRMYTNTYIAD